MCVCARVHVCWCLICATSKAKIQLRSGLTDRIGGALVWVCHKPGRSVLSGDQAPRSAHSLVIEPVRVSQDQQMSAGVRSSPVRLCSRGFRQRTPVSGQVRAAPDLTDRASAGNICLWKTCVFVFKQSPGPGARSKRSAFSKPSACARVEWRILTRGKLNNFCRGGGSALCGAPSRRTFLVSAVILPRPPTKGAEDVPSLPSQQRECRECAQCKDREMKKSSSFSMCTGICGLTRGGGILRPPAMCKQERQINRVSSGFQSVRRSRWRGGSRVQHAGETRRQGADQLFFGGEGATSSGAAAQMGLVREGWWELGVFELNQRRSKESTRFHPIRTPLSERDQCESTRIRRGDKRV